MGHIFSVSFSELVGISFTACQVYFTADHTEILTTACLQVVAQMMHSLH